jgi:hypothetical protein
MKEFLQDMGPALIVAVVGLVIGREVLEFGHLAAFGLGVALGAATFGIQRLLSND